MHDPKFQCGRPWAREAALGALALALISACGSGGGGSSPSTPPKNLFYGTDFALYAVGVDAVAAVPTFVGSVQSFTVTPDLPAGLVLDPATGRIDGTPTSLAGVAPYTVRASNAFGFVEDTLEIGVVEPANFVVAANSSDDTLSTYTVNAGTGMLSPTGHAISSRGADFPRGIESHRGGRVVYVANRASSDISVYDIDPANGLLTERATVPTLGASPNALVMHPTLDVLYVVSKTGTHLEAFGVDPNDGALTSLGGLALPSNGYESVVIDPDGAYLWLSNINANILRTIALDRITGLPSDTALEIPTANDPTSMVLSRDRRFLYSCALSGHRLEVFAVDALTGALSKVQSLLTGTFPARIVLAPSGRFLYAAISSEDTIRTYSVDAATGLLTQIGTTPTGRRPATLALDPTGSFLYTTETNPPDDPEDVNSGELGVYSIDRLTGALLRLESMRTRLDPVHLAVVSGDAPLAPHANFVYVANSGSDNLSMFTANPVTGSLDELAAELPVGGQPQAVVAHPSGRFVFAANTADDEVMTLSVDPILGQLQVVGSPTPVGDEPVALAVDGSGRSLYVLDRASADVRQFSIDASTGALAFVTQVGVPGGSEVIAPDPSGRFVVVASPTSNTVTVLDSLLVAGALTEVIQPAPFSGAPSAIAIHPNGRTLLATFATTGRLGMFSLEPTGALVNVASKPSGANPSSIAVHGSGRFVYVANRDSASNGDVTIFRVDTMSSILTRVDEAASGVHPVAAAVDPSGQFLYVANETSDDVTRWLVNPSSGRLTSPESAPAGDGPQSLAIVGSLQ